MRKKIPIVLALIFAIALTSKAQLSGSYTIPGTYTSIAAVINDLNTLGISGSVTININAGYSETAPVGGYTLTATGTSVNPIVFQKSGVGANPLIIAYGGGTGTPGTAVQDGVWRLVGSDYITIDGVDISDPNLTNPSTMEFGYGLFKASATDGCQNNTIKNCVITLNRENNALGTAPAVDGSRGIDVVNALTGAHTTALTITAASGANSNNKFYSNTIQNCNIGIALIGFADITPFTNADTGNDIGGSISSNGNTIINFGGGAAATNPAAGIRTLAQYNINVSYNTINNNNGAGVNHVSTLRGIYLNTAVSANATINNNTLTIKSGATTSQVSVIENLSGATAAGNTVSISNNLITNCTNSLTTTGIWYGIYNNGASAANLNISNNTFTNNTTNATTGATYLIYNTGAVNSSINLTNNNLSFAHTGTVAYSGTLYNIYNSASSITTTLNANNNIFASYSHSLTGTGSIYFLYNLGSSYALNINNNIANNIVFNHSGAQYYLYNSSSTQYSLAVTGNSITNITRNASAGTIYCYYAGSSSLGTSFQTFANNLFSNITATVSGTGSLYGIWTSDGASSPYPKKAFFNNTISNINYNATGTFYGMYMSYLGDGSTTTGSTVFNNLVNNITWNGTLYGMYYSSIASPAYPPGAYTNTVSNLISNGAASSVYGSYVTSGAIGINYYKNKIFNITENGATGVAYGLYISATLANIYNNLVGSVNTPSSSGANRVNGIYLGGGTTANLFYNSVYLNATSTGTAFGSNALYASTTPNLNLRNNIFVNNSTPTGTETAVAYRRSSTTLTTYSSTSNNNLFYAGVPSTSNLIYHDGTTPQQTLAAFKTLVSPRDAVSVTENPTFVSTTGSNPNFLNINTVTPTQIESGATPVAGITDDYIGTIRNVTTPDIGAWEGNYTSSADLLPPSLLASGFSTSPCNLTSRTFTVNFSDLSGVASGSLSPRVYYNLNGGAYTSVQGTLTAGTATNGVWTFNLTYSGALGDVVNYYTVAQDIASTPNLGASPSAGFVGTNVNSVTTPPTTPNSYTLVGTLSGTYNVGATGTYTSLTQAANAYNISCLSGPVTFVLTDPSYSSLETFPVVFNNNPYASSTNSLLVVPAAGVNVSVVNTTTATSVIKFLNSKYITVNGLNTGGSSISVTNNYSVSPAVIWLASTSAVGPGNNTIGIKNLTLNGAVSTSGYGIISGVDGTIPSTTAGIDNDNITIQGNKILTVNYGIYANGTATTTAGLDNWNISSNAIGPVTSSTNNIGFQGVYLGNLNGLAVINNTIANVVGTNAYEYGITLTTGVRNATINLNTINSIKYTGTAGYSGIGIDVNVNNTAANITIQNNMLSDITGDGWSGFTAGAICGMRVAASSSVGGINIQNNSIAINQGTTTGNTTANVSAAIYFGANSSNVDLRNNILYSNVVNSANAAAQTYAIYSAASATAFTSINYNNYYTAGSQAYLAFIAATSQTNLAMIQSGFGQNTNSQNIMPVFTASTDLHLVPGSNAPLDNLGTPISGITVDIDGQTRSLTTPDIGADEFSAPTCSVANGGSVASSSYSICNGQALTVISNSVSSGANTVYQWMSSSSAAGPFTVVAGGTGATTPTFVTGALSTGTLYLLLQTTCTSLSLTANSNTVMVYIGALPTVAVNPSTSTFCAPSGSPVGLTGSGASTYSWLPVSGLSATTGSLVNATPSVSTLYTVTAANAIGCIGTATAMVNVSAGLNLDSVIVSPNIICSGGNATLTAYASNPTFTYCQPAYSSGSGSGDYIGGVTLSTLTNTSGPLATPYYTLYPASFATTTLTAGSAYTLFVQAGTWSGTGNNIAAFIDYNQNGNLSDAGEKLGETTNLGVFPAVGTITFTVPPTALNGNVRFRVREVYVTTNIDPCASATFGETEDYNITVAGGVNPTFTYSWSPTAFLTSTNTSVTNVSSATLTTAYTVSVANIYGCAVTGVKTLTVNPTPSVTVNSGTICSGSSFTITPAGALTYTITGGSSVVSPTVTASYSVTGTSSLGCVSSSPAVSNVSVTNIPVVSISGTSVICSGQTVSLTANGAATYLWNTGATTNTIATTPTANITYTVTGANGSCTNSAVSNVSVTNTPTVSVVGTSGICSGQTVSLTAIGATTYSWNTGATTNTIAATPTANITYTVTGANGSCTNSSVSNVSVTNTPTVSVLGTSVICSGQTVSLTANGAATYSWNTGATTNTIATTPTANITYTVIGANGSCTNNAVKAVTVNALPTVSLSANSSTACTNGSPVAMSGSPAGGIYGGPNVSGILFTPGAVAGTFIPTYAYTNTVTGCSKTATTQIVVSVCTGLEKNFAEGSALKVYPNPNTGLFVIELANGFDKTIEVSDLTGRVVTQNYTSLDTFKMDISNLANGVYYVRILTNNEVSVLKIVKQ